MLFDTVKKNHKLITSKKGDIVWKNVEKTN